MTPETFPTNLDLEFGFHTPVGLGSNWPDSVRKYERLGESDALSWRYGLNTGDDGDEVESKSDEELWHTVPATNESAQVSEGANSLVKKAGVAFREDDPINIQEQRVENKRSPKRNAQHILPLKDDRIHNKLAINF